jgi:hypothetical protein
MGLIKNSNINYLDHMEDHSYLKDLKIEIFLSFFIFHARFMEQFQF